MIKLIKNQKEIEKIMKESFNDLHDWFEDDNANLNYINTCKKSIFVADCEYEIYKGFISLIPTSKFTAELHIMGVKKEFQRQGIGRKLFEFAKQKAKNQGFEFLQVKTVKEGIYKEYDATNKFYKSLGFKEFEVIPEIWDENNPCQIYIMAI